MSISPHPARADRELDAVVARAGGVLCGLDERSVAVNYGSAAGELAACVSRVGLADRSELVKLSLEAPRRTLQQVVLRLTGSTLMAGGALRTQATWWCATGPEQVLVLCEAPSGDRLHRRIRQLVARHPALEMRDLSARWSAIAIVGRRAGGVLADLGVYGESRDPRRATPVTRHRAMGADVLWLLQADHRALALMAHQDAPEVWQALHRAGQRYGICAVGREAIARYELLARTQPER